MPSLLVLVTYCTPVTSLTATISASTITPLEGSDTSPLMFPLGDCAQRGIVIATTQKARQTRRAKYIRALLRKNGISGTLPVHSQDGQRKYHTSEVRTTAWPSILGPSAKGFCQTKRS